MSSSGAQRSPVHLLTVGDFDPQVEKGIEYDFVGRVIAGRYTVQKHIGGGGMADVYQATDEQLGIEVAIKLARAATGAGSRSPGPTGRLAPSSAMGRTLMPDASRHSASASVFGSPFFRRAGISSPGEKSNRLIPGCRYHQTRQRVPQNARSVRTQ